MKKCRFILIIAYLMLFTVTAFAERKLVIVAEEFPPFKFINDGIAVGIDVDIAAKNFNEMNIDFEVQTLPWQRAWNNIEIGRADAIFSTSMKDKRTPFLYYPEEDMWNSEYVFFTQGNLKSLYRLVMKRHLIIKVKLVLFVATPIMIVSGLCILTNLTVA